MIRNDRVIPIEIKYQSTINNSDLKGIFKFSESYETDASIIISRDLFGRKRYKKRDFLIIPAWLALLVWN